MAYTFFARESQRSSQSASTMTHVIADGPNHNDVPKTLTSRLQMWRSRCCRACYFKYLAALCIIYARRVQLPSPRVNLQRSRQRNRDCKMVFQRLRRRNWTITKTDETQNSRLQRHDAGFTRNNRPAVNKPRLLPSNSYSCNCSPCYGASGHRTSCGSSLCKGGDCHWLKFIV